MTEADILTLGELIGKLEECNQDAWVYFDFGSLKPTAFCSYRGNYSDLALGFNGHCFGVQCRDIRVSTLLAMCRDATKNVFEGYKGGKYMMTLDSRVWASNEGWSSGTGIIGVRQAGNYAVILETDYVEQ